jgi:ribosomal-protein-alanine N-acetyltransferase
MEGIKLVPMEACHLDALAELERICFAEPWTRGGLEAELSSGTAVFLVAECGSETAGYGGMHCVCGECYVDNIAVFPKFRRRGVGRMLTQGLIDRARGRGAEFFSLEVRPSNLAAVALYRSLGLKETGRRKNFYRNPSEDALILTRYFHDKNEGGIQNDKTRSASAVAGLHVHRDRHRIFDRADQGRDHRELRQQQYDYGAGRKKMEKTAEG